MAGIGDRIKTGVSFRPPKVLVYGQHGIGKTSFGASFPDPLFLCAEVGAEELGVARLDLTCFEDVLEAVNNPITSYKTIVLDTLDALGVHVNKYVLDRYNAGKKDKVESIEDLEYGAGYALCFEQWQKLFFALDRPQDARQYVLLAHSRAVKFKNPSGADYDRWTLKLAKNAISKTDVGELAAEWADIVGFARFEPEISVTKAGKGSVDALGAIVPYRRRLELRWSPAWDAKCRLPLPASLNMIGGELVDAIEKRPRTCEEMLPIVLKVAESTGERYLIALKGRLEKPYTMSTLLQCYSALQEIGAGKK